MCCCQQICQGRERKRGSGPVYVTTMPCSLSRSLSYKSLVGRGETRSGPELERDHGGRNGARRFSRKTARKPSRTEYDRQTIVFGLLITFVPSMKFCYNHRRTDTLPFTPSSNMLTSIPFRIFTSLNSIVVKVTVSFHFPRL